MAACSRPGWVNRQRQRHDAAPPVEAAHHHPLGAMWSWADAAATACATRARLCAVIRLVDGALAEHGSIEKSNHANEPGPMRNGARKLTT